MMKTKEKQSLKLNLIFTILFFSFLNVTIAEARGKPLALVYQGEGSCEEGCSEAAAHVAELAGFRVQYVAPDALSETATPAQVKALFEHAKVWIQPGGIAVTAYFAMSGKLRQELVHFIADGGGYVGFCAGAYLATSQIGSTRYAGLGILPGGTEPYRTHTETPAVDYSFQDVSWNGKHRKIYYEGGPVLYNVHESETTGSAGEIIAYYETGDIAAARASFGAGRVFVSGPHPEAPAIWSEEDGLHDPDGIDHDLAVQMVRWAGRH